MREVILPPLEVWQQEVFDVVKDAQNSGQRFIIKAKRQVGKSILCIVLLIYYSLNKKGISLLIEPTQAQCRRVYKQIVDCLEGSGIITQANATLLTITFINGSEIIFKSCEQNTDSLRGYTVSNICIIDEGAFCPTDIYNIIYPMTDAHNAPILIVSTPLFANGEYYELYQKGLIPNDKIVSFDWSKYDTSKYLSDEKLEFYRQTVAPLKFKSEYLGEFIEEGSYTFGNINECVNNTIFKGLPKYGGIDWATGNNGDYTVLTLMDNNKNVVDIHSFKNLDAVEQVDKLASIINSYPSLKKIQVEMNSIGRVFYDNLKRQVKVYIKRFTTTNESKRKIIEQLIQAFSNNLITIPNDNELLKELQHYAVEKTKTGYTYNGIDGVNDDYVISLALCYDIAKEDNNNFQLRLV